VSRQQQESDAYSAGYADGRGWSRAHEMIDYTQAEATFYQSGYEDGNADRVLEDERLGYQNVTTMAVQHTSKSFTITPEMIEDLELVYYQAKQADPWEKHKNPSHVAWEVYDDRLR